MLPTYCLPAQDVDTSVLRESAEPGAHAFSVSHDLEVDDLKLPAVAQLFRDPPAPLQDLDGHWTFAWDSGLSWFEEALEVRVHARDPSKRVDAVPSERHIRVELEGEVLAESRRPVAVFETTLPTRWYLPADDVRQDLLVPSDTVTQCPYKGTATYWSARVGESLHQDVAWTYLDPIPECPRLAGLVCLLNEGVDLVIDGTLAERPRTPWSK